MNDRKPEVEEWKVLGVYIIAPESFFVKDIVIIICWGDTENWDWI